MLAHRISLTHPRVDLQMGMGEFAFVHVRVIAYARYTKNEFVPAHADMHAKAREGEINL